jgi:hypothetical protein
MGIQDNEVRGQKLVGGPEVAVPAFASRIFIQHIASDSANEALEVLRAGQARWGVELDVFEIAACELVFANCYNRRQHERFFAPRVGLTLTDDTFYKPLVGTGVPHP